MSRAFNGADANYLSISNPIGAIDITGLNFTIAAWVKAITIPANGRIAGKDSQTGVTPRGWNLHTYQGNWRFEILDASGGGYNLVSPASTGAWVHLCCVHNSGYRCSMYVNGVEAAGSNQARQMADTAFDFTIGRNPSLASSAFNGNIGEVAIWKASLSAAEASHLSKGISPYMVRLGNLAGYWSLWGFGPSAVGTEYDLSGGTEHLSTIGSVGFSVDHPLIVPLIAA